MKAVNLIIAILVAFGAAGIAFYMANAQTTDLKEKIKLLEDNLEQTKSELGQAKQELAKADTSKLHGEVNELSDALWGKVGDLGKKDAELEARIEKLASMPPPVAAPRVEGRPGDPDNSYAEGGEEDLGKIMKGIGERFKGFGEQMAKRQVERYREQLNLNESQAEDLSKLMTEQSQKMMENMRKMFEGGEQGDRREMMEQMRQDFEDSVAKILTAEQFEKFKELEQSQTRRWGGMFGGGRPRRGQGEGQQPGPGGGR